MSYIPVSIQSTAINKLQILLGTELPSEIIDHFKKYNFGEINDLKILGINSSDRTYSNLLVSLPNLKRHKQWPSSYIPLVIKNGKYYGYDLADKKIYSFEEMSGDYEDTTFTLDNLVEELSSNTTASMESVTIPDFHLRTLVRLLKNEVDVEHVPTLLSIAIAYSLEADLHSESVLGYYSQYHQVRVNEIVRLLSNDIRLPVKKVLENVAEIYVYRCKQVRDIPDCSFPFEDVLKENEKYISITRKVKTILVDHAI